MHRFASLLLLAAAGLSAAACGGGERSPAPGPVADPGVERLSAACRAYFTAAGRRIPPASTREYVRHLFDRTDTANSLADDIRAVKVPGRDRAKRGALLAAAAEIQTQLAYLVREDNPDYQEDFFGERLIRGSASLLDAERGLERAADRAGVRCARPPVPPEAREFARAAVEACERAGTLTGEPRRDADALRARADALAALPAPDQGGELARAALKAEERLARAAGRAGRALEPYAVAGAGAQEIWARQGADRCAAVFG